MTSPAAAPDPIRGTVEFHKLIEGAAKLRKTADYALKMGVIPSEILSYVRGHLSTGQRREVQAMLARSEWAMGRVVALVKARRDPTSFGARILESTTNPEDEDTLAALLDQV